MLEVDWEATNGWSNPVIKPFGLLSVHPYNSALHYAVQCFEGQKAFKDDRGNVRLFRPECNMYRLKKSCSRVALPDFDGKELLECIKQLVKLEESWVPPKQGFSL